MRVQNHPSHFLSLFSSPHLEAIFGLLACSLPGPRKKPPTQHRAACYSSVCPQGAWTPGHKPHLTLEQSCLSLSGADTSLVASGCLHHSSVCKETMMLPSICERKANQKVREQIRTTICRIICVNWSLCIRKK